MNIRTLGVAALLALCVAVTGCATSRSEVKITSPAGSAAAPVKERAVVIRTVKDERSFQAAPTDPSVPSIGTQGAGTVAGGIDAVKSRAIARKRNTYGQALGDVLLQDGQTVPGLVREHLEASFRDAGFRVARDPASAGSSPLLVDVSIRKFWAWMNPGFWAITLNADIETDLVVSGAGQPTVISVKHSQKQQVATEAVWIETIEKALGAYRKEATGKLAGPPF